MRQGTTDRANDVQTIFFGHAQVAAVLLGLLACFAAFVLPFLFPGNQPVFSAAYVAGANNKVATVCLALLSVVVALWAAWKLRRASPSTIAEDPGLSRRTLLLGSALVALWTAVFGGAIVHAGVRYGESTYFIERAHDVLDYRLALYTQLEFPYGPLLLLPSVWLARAFAWGVPACYFLWLTVLNAGGILLAGYVLNRLPLTAFARRLLFCLFCFEQLHPLLGANYSLGKFMLPFAVLVWGTRQQGPLRQLLALTAGDLLVLLVSPELGVGLAGGIAVWALLAAVRSRRPAPLLACLAPFAAAALFLSVYGRGFLDRLGNASAGALNLVLEPLPDLFILLAALVWFAPIAVARGWNSQTPRAEQAPGPLLAALFVLSLGLLPGALGRADPLHVFFNGFGLLMLSLVGIERLQRTGILVWAGLLLLLGLQVQATNFKVYQGPLIALLHAARHPGTFEPDFDPASLKAETHGEIIATPALQQLPYADELALRQDGQFDPDKTDGLADIWDAAGEQARIARMRHHRYALLSTGDFRQAEGLPNADRLKRMLRFGYRYPERRPIFVLGALLQQELARHWVPVDRFGGVVLYRRVS